MRPVALALLIAAAAPAAATTPIAEVICEPTHRMTEKLSRQFGASPRAWGTRGPEQVMQVWTDRSGDWTLVVAYATGTSCIVAMGENWASTAPDGPA
jgi:predicted methyltransferase